MKTEQLKELGLTDEQIGEVFKLRGQEISERDGIKHELETMKTENEALKEQIQTANTEIEGFKNLDIDAIKTQANEYKHKFEASEQKRQEDLNKANLNHAIELGLVNAGARNVQASKALLNLEELSQSKNINDDLKTQIDALKESDSYLFKLGDSQKQSMGETGSIPEKKDFKDMTYAEMVEANKKGLL